jgi:hypothetical protein
VLSEESRYVCVPRFIAFEFKGPVDSYIIIILSLLSLKRLFLHICT